MENLFNPISFGRAVLRYRNNFNCECGKQMGVRFAAKQIGISSATLSRVENGLPTSIENFAKICLWMNTSPNYWIRYRNER